MNAPRLKICGLRQPDQARAVAAMAVDAIGVIGVPASPRNLLPARRAELFAAVAAERPACLRVLVVADPADADLDLLDPVGGGHQVVQLHGSESPQRCRELCARVAGVTWWKALRIRNPGDLQLARSYGDVVDALLLDAWVPDQLGGTGHALPLEWLRGFAAAIPWWLAGGITPERVPEVLEVVRPFGLDASSGVEKAPGDKDLARVAALATAVRAGSAAAGISG